MAPSEIDARIAELEMKQSQIDLRTPATWTIVGVALTGVGVSLGLDGPGRGKLTYTLLPVTQKRPLLLPVRHRESRAAAYHDAITPCATRQLGAQMSSDRQPMPR